MKALVKTDYGKGKVELLDVEEPTPASNQVKIKVEYGGLCGTDIHIFEDDGYPYSAPVILGHEFSGTIVETGKNVRNIKEGDRVVAETNASVCNECGLCKSGRLCLCNERKALGQKYDGVFAEYFVIGQETIHIIPESVDFVTAAVTEPLSCVVHALNERSKISAGDTVVVSGPGPIGLLALQVLKTLGATVIVAGTSADNDRLEKARELDADFTVNVEKDDIQGLIERECGGIGADVIVECSGSGSAVNLGIDLLKKCGIFTQIGLFRERISVDVNKLCFKEINFFGCLSKTNYSWRKSLRLLEKAKVDTKVIVSDIFALHDWETAFNHAKEKKGLKILLKP